MYLSVDVITLLFTHITKLYKIRYAYKDQNRILQRTRLAPKTKLRSDKYFTRVKFDISLKRLANTHYISR